MTMLKVLAITAISVLAWWIPIWAGERADRLELEGTDISNPTIHRDEPIVRVNGVRQFDDVPLDAVIGIDRPDGSETKIFAPADPDQQEMLKKAAVYRNVSNATTDWWWYLPLALSVLLIVSKATSLFQRPTESETVEKAVDHSATEAAHKREMEKLDKLIELERLKQSRPPEPPQPESRTP